MLSPISVGTDDSSGWHGSRAPEVRDPPPWFLLSLMTFDPGHVTFSMATGHDVIMGTLDDTGPPYDHL